MHAESLEEREKTVNALKASHQEILRQKAEERKKAHEARVAALNECQSAEQDKGIAEIQLKDTQAAISSRDDCIVKLREQIAANYKELADKSRAVDAKVAQSALDGQNSSSIQHKLDQQTQFQNR